MTRNNQDRFRSRFVTGAGAGGSSQGSCIAPHLGHISPLYSTPHFLQ
ncbi:MAG TPA: hypothetical protein P5116_08140 [Eubacteriales bacterium]|nr:hypothetical protein [Clostridia bacterium]HRV73828.1 hypothetical protein [Eubacteriales bacterium]